MNIKKIYKSLTMIMMAAMAVPSFAEISKDVPVYYGFKNPMNLYVTVKGSILYDGGKIHEINDIVLEPNSTYGIYTEGLEKIYLTELVIYKATNEQEFELPKIQLAKYHFPGNQNICSLIAADVSGGTITNQDSLLAIEFHYRSSVVISGPDNPSASTSSSFSCTYSFNTDASFGSDPEKHRRITFD